MSEVPVEVLLGRIATVAGRAVTWEPLPGGLSHHIYLLDADYLVDADDDRYVLRVLQPAVSAAGLGMPPADEVENTLAADVRDPALAEPIATACRALHSGERFGTDFDTFAKREELLALCARHDLPVPEGHHDHDDAVGRLRSAPHTDPLPPVPCHNDLLPEDFVREPDGRVRIIDHQLAGNNDPSFEPGDIAAEADFDPDQVGRLAAAYFGPEHSVALLARVRLNLIASNVTWTLWFAVHCGLITGGDSGFDHAGEAADKWGQAAGIPGNADFDRKAVNYAPIALLIVVAVVAVVWFANGRKHFTGMRRNVDEPAQQ